MNTRAIEFTDTAAVPTGADITWRVPPPFDVNTSDARADPAGAVAAWSQPFRFLVTIGCAAGSWGLMDRDSGGAELAATYERVRRFAAVVGPPDVEPDDLVQEAFVRALNRGLDGIDDLTAYLRRTVLNLSSTSRRSWVRRRAAMARLGPAVQSEEMYVPMVSDLFRLPADLRAALWLVEVEGWSYAEVGRVLGCSEDAARTRASRARRRLRLELIQEMDR
jgi:RNA polymerase sigma-70 factor (ECF subfamily)